MLALLGAGIAACLVGVAALGDLRAHLPTFVLLFGAAFAVYLVAVWRVVRRPAAARRRPWLILGFATAFRLILLAVPPTLSDDLYRYVWEGRVLAHGASPYRYAPDDPALTTLRDDAIWLRVNNLDVPSPYPPAAQLAGLVASSLTPAGTVGAKLVSTAADLAVAASLLWLLAEIGTALGRDVRALVLVYAWHPLTLTSFSHSGHNDSLMLAPLVAALALATRIERTGRRAGTAPWLAAALVALAALSKVTPLLLLPLLPRRLGWGPTIFVGALVAAAWLPFLWLGGGAIGSIATYLGRWADNDSLHAMLRLSAGASGAKVLTLGLLTAGIAAVALHPTLHRRPLWWQAYVVFGLSIVLASTVHAWYLTWLLPLLAALLATSPSPALGRLPLPALGWLLFSGSVALTYLTYDTHQWRLWISFAEYVPLFILLAAGAPWPALYALIPRRMQTQTLAPQPSQG